MTVQLYSKSCARGRSKKTTAPDVAPVAASNTTTAPVQPGDFSQTSQEFGRVQDVERVFGIKRGTLYSLLALGLIKGVLLRVRGSKSGVRLIHMNSVRAYIRAQMMEGGAAA